MEIQLEIDHDLWEAIKKNYEIDSYSSAILDAMHFLTQIVRDKTGLEGDGASLIGQAFGGENPKIQLNKLQTDSEKDIQKGTQDILKGLYASIRNPRSHDKYKDTKQETDALITFIDYLLKIIDKSKLSFEEETFLQRVFDEHYVESKEYSDLLVSEIPKRQRVNIAITILLRFEKGNIYHLSYFMHSLFEKLEDHEILRIYKTISDVLNSTTANLDIRYILHICPATLWPKIDKVARLRIENILFEDTKAGTYDTKKKEWGKKGLLGTWIEIEHIKNFDNISKWTSMILDKLKSTNEEKGYALIFLPFICNINRDNIDYSLKIFFSEALKNKDEDLIEKLKDEICYDKNHPWWKIFKKELDDYPEIKYIDDLPF